MTTQEHLEKIKTKCESLLAIAEKRMSGKWKIRKCPCGHPYCSDSWPGPMKGVQGSGYDPSDATFIASCAGPAEAGWRATIAAIDAYRSSLSTHNCEIDMRNCVRDEVFNTLIKTIVAAWPEELL